MTRDEQIETALQQQRDMTQAEWIKQTEHDVRTACHANDRVSDVAADYDIDQPENAYMLRHLRTQITRLIKSLEAENARMFDLKLIASRLPRVAELLSEDAAKCDIAAEQAVVDKIEHERARRVTPQAWQKWRDDLARRERYLLNPEARMSESQ